MANQVVPREAHLDGKPSVPRNWRDLFSSSWKDTDYKVTAIASLIQAVYFLELDRQENRTEEDALAPKYWTPFKYKPTQVLIDERDGSIFGAIFEWDRFAALADLRPFRPSGAPRVVLALRGTLIRYPTVRRDFEDDFRFVAWDNLKGSVRFKVALDAVKSVSDTYGSSNVCIAGHSLGAGFGLQVGKELEKEGINVEAHLFNPPAVSLAISLGNIGEMAEYVWNGVKSVFPSGSEAQGSYDGDKNCSIRLKRLIPRLSQLIDGGFGRGKWVPHLYVNNNDWISFFYIHADGTRENITDMENMGHTKEKNAAKLYVVSKENQKFLEAHSLKQWWSNDVQLQQDIHNRELICKKLRSLNTAMSLINIRQTSDFIWNGLKYVPHLIWNGDNTSGIVLKGWIPQLFGLKDAVYWVGKWVPHLYVNKNDGAGEKMMEKENMGPTNGEIIAKLFVVSKEQQKFLAAHGLEQWWPSEAELLQAFHNSKLISRQISTPWEVTQILNPSSVSLAMSLSNIGEMEEFVWKWNILKCVLHSNGQAQVSNDGENASAVGFKGWIPQLSGLKDAVYWIGKWVPYLYVNKNDGIRENMVGKEDMGPANGQITAKLFGVSKEQQNFLAAHGLEQWRPSEAELHQAFHNSKLISRQISTPWEVTQILNPSSVSLAMSLSNIGEMEEFVWKWKYLKSMHPSSSESQVSIDGDKTSGVPLKSWIPPLSGLKDAGFAAGKWVPHSHMYSNYSDHIGRQLRSFYSLTPSQVSHLFNLPAVFPAMSLGDTVEKANFVWNRLKSLRPSSSEAQVNNDADKTSGVGLNSWIPLLSGLKDAGFWVGKLAPYLYGNKSGGTEEKMVDKENMGP
ncbi:Alpha/Beta hydrolase fold [Sesbania bispinosa]|nr:Alpha/Beta hydrolase fold [Sesbania bispinosa]